MTHEPQGAEHRQADAQRTMGNGHATAPGSGTLAPMERTRGLLQ